METHHGGYFNVEHLRNILNPPSRARVADAWPHRWTCPSTWGQEMDRVTAGGGTRKAEPTGLPQLYALQIYWGLLVLVCCCWEEFPANTIFPGAVST